MKVLIACEFSGIVREAFRVRGHDAWSCDLLPSEIPGQHIQGDVLEQLNKGWDMMICHPPCTHLAVSGARYFAGKQAEQAEALKLVRDLFYCDIPHVCLENPISIISRLWTPDQIIQPWQFGHRESKSTCLWLKQLPLLKPTNIIIYEGHADNQTPSGQNKLGPSPDRWKIRSRTYPGIADAMADQWGSMVGSYQLELALT